MVLFRLRRQQQGGLVLGLLFATTTNAFQQAQILKRTPTPTALCAIDLKAELTSYLAERKKQGADEAAKAEIGKVVGGTKGNKVLDFVSGSPNKPFVIEEASNVFDYDELTKYGYAHLVTPIMEGGGRLAVYQLMDMVPPPVKPKVKAKNAPKLEIDRTGQNDQARYTGLKMTMDDDSIAAALEEAQRKAKEGQRLRPRLVEEDYVMPFSEKRNTGPRLTPDWTPELLDEEGKKRGRAIAWARKAAAGEFVSDPFETMNIEGGLRAYSAVAVLFCALAFGKSTPYALEEWFHVDKNVLAVIQVPALVVLLAAVGSGVVSYSMAAEKNRSKEVWMVKGLFGGPVALSQLRGLESLLTQGETDQQAEDLNQLAQEKRRAGQQ